MQALQLSDIEAKQGDQVQLSGLTQELRLMRRSSKVTTASYALRAAVPSVPRFRPVHEEVSPSHPVALNNLIICICCVLHVDVLLCFRYTLDLLVCYLRMAVFNQSEMHCKYRRSKLLQASHDVTIFHMIHFSVFHMLDVQDQIATWMFSTSSQ